MAGELTSFGALVPVDHQYFVYGIMLAEGLGNLFPWNAFITAFGYFADRFCGTSIETNFENYFSLTFTLSQVIGLALSIRYQNNFSFKQRIVWPLFCYSAIFLLTTILVLIDVDPTLLFWVTLLSTCLCGFCGAVLSGGLFGLAALFPPLYTGALMSGQGLAGLTVSISSLLTTIAGAATLSCEDTTTETGGTVEVAECNTATNYSALAYFIIATVILLLCVVSYLALRKFPFARYYIDKADVISDQQYNPISDKEPDTKEERLLINSVTGHQDHEDGLEMPQQGQSQGLLGMSFSEIWRVFSILKVPALSVMLTFMVTIGLFPSTTVLVDSMHKCESTDRFYNDLFTPFFFLLFNLFDFFGRFTAGSTKPIFTIKNVWIPCVLRIVFFPLFMLTNMSTTVLPVVFNHDAYPIIFMILFASTNGYVASTCMMIGPAAVEVKDAALAGTIMVFCLTFGLFLGASTSFLIVYIIQGYL